jgi:chromosome segregation ATPase
MCKQNGNGWHWLSRSAWPWVLVVCFFLWSGPCVGAQNAIDSEPSQNSQYELSLNASLNEADSNLQMLLLRLSERRQQVEALQTSLQQAEQSLNVSELASVELDQQLQEAQASVMSLQQELRETLISLAGVRTQYDMLSEAFGAYVGEMQEQKRGLASERDRTVRQAKLWRLGALAGGGLAVGAGIIILILLVR